MELIKNKFKIKKMPQNLKTIKCDEKYEYVNDFKNYKVIYH